jgi:hypothetical protein
MPVPAPMERFSGTDAEPSSNRARRNLTRSRTRSIERNKPVIIDLEDNDTLKYPLSQPSHVGRGKSMLQELSSPSLARVQELSWASDYSSKAPVIEIDSDSDEDVHAKIVHGSTTAHLHHHLEPFTNAPFHQDFIDKKINPVQGRWYSPFYDRQSGYNEMFQGQVDPRYFPGYYDGPAIDDQQTAHSASDFQDLNHSPRHGPYDGSKHYTYAAQGEQSQASGADVGRSLTHGSDMSMRNSDTSPLLSHAHQDIDTPHGDRLVQRRQRRHRLAPIRPDETPDTIAPLTFSLQPPYEYEFQVAPKVSVTYVTASSPIYVTFDADQRAYLLERITEIRPYVKGTVTKDLNSRLTSFLAEEILSGEVTRSDSAIEHAYPDENCKVGRAAHWMKGLSPDDRREAIRRLSYAHLEGADWIRRHLLSKNKIVVKETIQSILDADSKERIQQIARKYQLIPSRDWDMTFWKIGASELQLRAVEQRIRNNSRFKKNVLLLKKRFVPRGFGMQILRANDDQFVRLMQWLVFQHNLPVGMQYVPA